MVSPPKSLELFLVLQSLEVNPGLDMCKRVGFEEPEATPSLLWLMGRINQTTVLKMWPVLFDPILLIKH